jgi:hypothetical protein
MTLPRAKNDRILWKKVPGFAEWFRAEAPGKTNWEMVQAFREKWHVEVTVPTVNSLRATFSVHTHLDARRRAYAERDNRIHPDAPELSPVEKMHSDSLKREVERLSKKQTFYEMVGDRIVEAVKAIPCLPVMKPKTASVPKGLKEEEMVLLLSDVQAGTVVSAKESGGLGEFHTGTLIEEIDYLEQAIRSIRRYHPNVRTLNVFWLGDIVEGETIFEGQGRVIDMNVVQQSIFCIEKFARFLNNLAGEFARLKNFGVIGNHGRIGKKGVHGPLSNFDYLVYRMLEKRFENHPTVTWDISESWWQLADVQTWTFLLTHGDKFGTATWGIPFYGTQRGKTRYRELFKQSNVPDFDYMCSAHHHQPASFQRNIMNGNWIGGSEMSLWDMQSGGAASQTLFGVVETYGLTWQREINLRPIRRRRDPWLCPGPRDPWERDHVGMNVSTVRRRAA